MSEILDTVAHRPYPLPTGAWRMTQRWNDLLFAHWPIPADVMAHLLPPGLEVDLFDNYAWAGVVPFWMDRVRVRAMDQRTIAIPTTTSFCELNLRTYVRSRATGLSGVYFFSLDAESALAVLGARIVFHLPYFLANMRLDRESEGAVRYYSRRLLSSRNVEFSAKYRSLSPAPVQSGAGTIEHFLTERYCLFTSHRGRILVGDIHHLPWPLEAAEAEIARNSLPEAHGIVLPKRPPMLHFARELQVYIWPLREDR